MGGLDHDELVGATGLTGEQVSRGIFFHNERAARLRREERGELGT